MTALTKWKEAQNKEIENEELKDLYETNPLIGAGGLLDELSDSQQKFLVAKMYGGSDASACRATGINYHTMRNWKDSDLAFQTVYKMVTEMPLEMAAKVSAFGFAKAIDRIVKMMDNPNDKMAAWAIEKMLQIANITQANQMRQRNERMGGVDDNDVDRILKRIESERNGGHE